MRLATYNVHHGAPAKGPVDLRTTVEVCRALRADVLAIQELDSQVARSRHVDQPHELANALGLEVVFAATVEMSGGGRYGHALCSVHGFRDIDLVDLTVTAGREPRTAILATTTVADTPVEVCALHLENPRRADAAPMAVEQARFAFSSVAARAASSGHAAVVLGDLNLPAPIALELAREAGFTLAEGPDTYPATRPTRRIDHVAVRGLAIGSVQVPASDASDHRPLLAIARPLPSGPPGADEA